MGRHIIRSLIGMDEMGIIIGDKIVHESLKVGTGSRVRIFHKDEAATGVLDKHTDHAIGKPR
jgi:hypothetical protein